jgi:hypothetical protein
MVGESALHREATIRANQEGHRSLAGRYIVGMDCENSKAGRGEVVVLIGKPGPGWSPLAVRRQV